MTATSAPTTGTISGAEALRRLRRPGTTTRQARQVLALGLAGRAEVTVCSHRYDEAVVDELTRRPDVDAADLHRACPAGLFVARRDVPVTATWPQQAALLAPGWAFSALISALLRHRADMHGHVPLVATTGGFFTTGAEVVDVLGAGPSPTRTGEETRTLVLREPGPWFEQLARRRVVTSRGRPWVLVEPRLSPWAAPSAGAASRGGPASPRTP